MQLLVQSWGPNELYMLSSPKYMDTLLLVNLCTLALGNELCPIDKSYG